ncbi:hypothetical protein [Streptococcus catagoni]|uniref:hypothetical protein n=1 Tax=Streptococcus catagoni TaxID=2654874 RepID=UPI00140D1DDD|nr:hypothetical protein [Streptococcus catagoni]
MPVYTETKIRKLFRESLISDHGLLEIRDKDRLTPAAKSFLNDHHVRIRYVDQKSNKHSDTDDEGLLEPISSLEDSAVYPRLFHLSKLYPYLLRTQKEVHLAFEMAKLEQIQSIIDIVDQVLDGQILADPSHYRQELAGGEDLEAIRLREGLDQLRRPDYKSSDWQLSCYQTYIETVFLRKEFQTLLKGDRDLFACQLVSLLKSLEVLLWLVMSE